MQPKTLTIPDPLENWLESFRPYLEVLLDAYCILDRTGRIRDFNIAFTDLVGESHRRIKKAASLSELLKSKGAVDITESILTATQAVRLDEVPAESKAFPELTLIIGAVPVTDSSGEKVGTLATIRNVTAESELLSKYYDKKQESITDGLTGLLNKVNIEAAISKSIKTSLREGKPISFVMGDIDHFKKVNDTYGHPAGDYVLKLVASIVKIVIRETDLAGRFGGEEFAVLLHNCPESGAQVFAERLRRTIESTLFIFEGKRIPITLSQGTATFHQPWADGMNPDSLAKEVIRQADTALYEAKAQGRNRVIPYRSK